MLKDRYSSPYFLMMKMEYVLNFLIYPDAVPVQTLVIQIWR